MYKLSFFEPLSTSTNSPNTKHFNMSKVKPKWNCKLSFIRSRKNHVQISACFFCLLGRWLILQNKVVPLKSVWLLPCPLSILCSFRCDPIHYCSTTICLGSHPANTSMYFLVCLNGICRIGALYQSLWLLTFEQCIFKWLNKCRQELGSNGTIVPPIYTAFPFPTADPHAILEGPLALKSSFQGVGSRGRKGLPWSTSRTPLVVS